MFRSWKRFCPPLRFRLRTLLLLTMVCGFGTRGGMEVNEYGSEWRAIDRLASQAGSFYYNEGIYSNGVVIPIFR